LPEEEKTQQTLREKIYETKRARGQTAEQRRGSKNESFDCNYLILEL